MTTRRPIRRVIVIANPAAGRDEPVLSTLNDAWREAGIDWDVAVTHDAGDARRRARESAEAGADLVVAYGGDGTVMEVADGLYGTGAPLAILPGGTANVLAADLGIPGSIADAARVVTGPHAFRALDVGESGSRHFVLRMAAGLEAEMDLRADRERKDRLGVFAYPVAALEAAVTAPVSRYRLTLDGEEAEAEGVSIVVANSGSFGVAGLGMAPGIDVSDGMLDVAVLSGADVQTLLRLGADIMAGKQPAESHLKLWQARDVRVEAEPPQRVVCDGEPAGETPFSARILPGALRVMVPV